MQIDKFNAILGEVSFPDYTFSVVASDGNFYLQARYEEPDVVTGKAEVQKTRKWLLSRHMTKSEIVQTAFKCGTCSEGSGHFRETPKCTNCGFSTANLRAAA